MFLERGGEFLKRLSTLDHEQTAWTLAAAGTPQYQRANNSREPTTAETPTTAGTPGPLETQYAEGTSTAKDTTGIYGDGHNRREARTLKTLKQKGCYQQNERQQQQVRTLAKAIARDHNKSWESRNADGSKNIGNSRVKGIGEEAGP
jgi:hypothetical protein